MKIFLVIASILLSFSVKAQYHEIGFMVGTSYYVGDINPQFHLPTSPSLGGGLIYRYNFNDRIAFKGSILYNRISANDEDSKDSWQENRNLHFRNDLFEFSTQIEINFLTYEIGDRRRPSSPYLFLGIALFRHNPEAEFNDRWIDLQPLGTEGQGIEGFEERYSLTQVSIPFGVGFKFNIAGNFAGSVEWGMRRTFTDYLDDVSTVYVEEGILLEENGPLSAEMADRSIVPTGPDGTNTGMQRGETNREDWYVFTGLILSYKLGKPQVKCPTAFN